MTSIGDIIIADLVNKRIRLVATTGVISTIAGNGAGGYGGDGGPATSAIIYSPTGVAVTSTGAIVIADQGNMRIRLVASSIAPTPTASPTPSPTPYCVLSLFRALPRMDIVGSLAGTALSPGAPVPLPSESSCRQACCDAPFCDGYAFASGDMSFTNGGTAGCFLYVNVTQLIPSSAFSSGIYESTL